MIKRYIKDLAVMLILLMALSSGSVAQDTPEVRFRTGSELYSQGRYSEALDEWLSVYNTGIKSSSLDYNIANTYFKLNNIPGAILFYERALLLDPLDEDSRYNLQVARTMVVDKFTEVPELFFITWFNFLSLLLSSNLWAAISIGCFISFLLLLSLYIYSARYRNKVMGFWFGLLMLLISTMSLTLSVRNKNLVTDNKEAIIFSPVINGKSSPDESGTDLFVIHEGTKVTIEDAVGEWFEIRLADGNKGWVPADCLDKL